MPKPPLPLHLEELLSRPNPAVIATVRPDGSPVTVATWYDWQDGRILVSMDANRRRLAHLRADPRVSVTVLDPANWSHVSLRGRVISLDDDAQLADIDRLSQRYAGAPFRDRESPRVSAWIEIVSWHAWGTDET